MVDASPKRRLADAALRAVVHDYDAHAPLLDAIAASPDDAAPWAVYADLLQTEEHPRGELISLMMERERRPSVRLLELQRKHMAAHANALLPSARERVIAWRRGFASEVRIDAPEHLVEVQRDPALRFALGATLVIDSWTPWAKALKGLRFPWRHVRVEVANKKLDAALLLACTPALETLRIVFEKRGKVVWKGARGERLARIALVNAGTVDAFDDAELPALAELRLLGDSSASDALQTSVMWSRLQRVLVSDQDRSYGESGSKVCVTGQTAFQLVRPVGEDEPDYYEEPEQPSTTTFMIVGKPVDAGLIKRLAAKMSIAHLAARIHVVGAATVMQFFGPVEAELMPYGLAVALHGVLESTPIALVEVADGGARYLVLADTQARGKDARASDAVRRALDLALGYDPGSDALADLLDELSITPIETLLGLGGEEQLTMIDPSTAPLVVPEEIEPYDDDDDYDEDEWGYEGDDWDWEEAKAIEAAEPPRAMIVVTVPVETAAEVIEEEEVDLAYDDVETEDALTEQPERDELWFEFGDHWLDRAVAVDDEESDARWPDPIKKDPEYVEETVDFENQVADPACAKHRRALDDCEGCGAPHCVECGGEDWCSACFAVVVLGDATGVVARPR